MSRAIPGAARGVRIGLAVLVVVATIVAGGRTAAAQENPLEPLDTSSPQATYLSFVEQAERLEGLLRAYDQDRSEANQAAFSAALAKSEELFDLSEVSTANRSEVARSSFASLADILNRLPPPDVDEIPDSEDVEGELEEFTFPGTDVPIVRARGGVTDYTLPGTEITITRIEEGPRAGEYVFSAATVAALPEFREMVDDLPVNEGVTVSDWVREEREFTGHLVPGSWVDALPDTLGRDFLGSPLWKMIANVVLLGLVVVIASLWYRWVGSRGRRGTPGGYLFRLTTPILVLVLMGIARRLMDEQVNHSGDLAIATNVIVTLVIWVSWAWTFWLATKLVVEWIIANPAISDESIDAHLLRLLGRVASVGGAFALALVGLSRVGVSTVGLGIGAGIAGLAIALAATGALENLLGGITVYADKPFQVDDMISVDDELGTVEAIGPRSTRIRRLDDTRVSLPNADISRAKVTNYSERRHFLFLHVVGVRYETTIDQLKTIVEAIDSRFRAHPMVLDEADHPRVRVTGFGASSIDIEIRAHVDTDRLHVFTGVQQELLLDVYDIVEAAGSGFAFPSSTTYLAEDAGLAQPGRGPATTPSLAIAASREGAGVEPVDLTTDPPD